MNSLLIETTEGAFIASYSDSGLVRLEFPGPSDRRPSADDPASTPARSLPRWHRLTTAALRRMLAGRTAGSLPPLDWSGHTEFRRRVWSVLLRIETGRPLTYSQVAAAIGNPQAARAVGGACGANPIPVLVPCHRVVAAGGALGGFSAGLPWKRKLLGREGWKTAAGELI